jgi:hypothetical protein
MAKLKLKVRVNLSEDEINNIITALDYYTQNIDDDTDWVNIKRNLHTALTLARIDEIDNEEDSEADGFENGCEGCVHLIESTRIECTYKDRDLDFEDVDYVAKHGCPDKKLER